jgi:hypothetical protein
MKKFIAAIMSFFAPLSVALAQVPVPQTAGGTDAADILGDIDNILDTVIPILITIAVIIFIVGVIQYITAKEDDQKKLGRDKIIYGIIGLFVILSVFGIIAVLGNTLGIGQGGTLDSSGIPQVVQ